MSRRLVLLIAALALMVATLAAYWIGRALGSSLSEQSLITTVAGVLLGAPVGVWTALELDR